MLMVVFGAGASFDSVPSIPPSEADISPREKRTYSSRLPLANQLFEDRQSFAEVVQRFPNCRPAIPRLRDLQAQSIEEKLEHLMSESAEYPAAKKQLASIRYYLVAMLGECQQRWLQEAHDVTNYLALLDRINRFRGNESVALVTFNYDTMLEKGFAEIGLSDQDIDDYIAHPHYKVFKVHGSINWGRYVEIAGLEDVLGRPQNPGAVWQRMIDISDRLKITDSYVVASPLNAYAPNGTPIFPAIAIPVRSKSHFECPEKHIKELVKLLPSVDRILVIGWRAAEEHFLRLLNEHLPKRVSINIVAGSAKLADETLRLLRGA